MSEKTKIILDTDPGIDDAQAIAFALAHPALDLLALTTVFGNAAVDLTTRNASIVLEAFGASEIPVARGAAVPLQQKPYPPADFVHGKDGLGELDLALNNNSEVEESAAELIVRLANESPGEITLVAVGPLTNIAAALALDPTLPGKLKELVVMGGAVTEPGNVTPVAEANFFNDPHAADAVASADWPLTVIGLDVTHQVLLTDTLLARLRDHAGKTGQFLWDTSRFYVDFYSRKGAARDKSEPACAMHDALALVYLVIRDTFGVVTGPSRVVTEGVAAGQFVLDRRGYRYALPHWEDRPDVSAAMTVDSALALETFVSTVETHKRQ